MNAAVFKQKDIEFFHKVTETDDQYTSMEEAAAAHGGLHEVAARLGVAERFLYELWQVPRLREKLTVLEFWHSYYDECSQAQVRQRAAAVPRVFSVKHRGRTAHDSGGVVSCTHLRCINCVCLRR